MYKHKLLIRNAYFHTVLQVCNIAFYGHRPPEVSFPLLIFSVDQRRHWYNTAFACGDQPTDQYIDNSFFVFTGMALAAGGPASLLISEVLAIIVNHCAMESLSEMNCYQQSGSFITFTHLYLDPAWSFAVGWIYAIRSMISISFAVAATARLLNLYLPLLGITVWVGVVLFLIVVLTFTQTKLLAQLAAIADAIKVSGFLGFA